LAKNWRPINQAKGVINKREEREMTETKELSDCDRIRTRKRE